MLSVAELTLDKSNLLIEQSFNDSINLRVGVSIKYAKNASANGKINIEINNAVIANYNTK